MSCFFCLPLFSLTPLAIALLLAVYAMPARADVVLDASNVPATADAAHAVSPAGTVTDTANSALTANAVHSAAVVPAMDGEASSAAVAMQDGMVPAHQGDTFGIRINAPSDVHALLKEHLELRRYQKVADLDAYELQRLLVASEVQIRQLLATRGYFAPTVQQKLEHATSRNGLPEVVIDVQTGERARIATAQVRLDGTIDATPSARTQHVQITRAWTDLKGESFTQDDWGTIKTETLKRLQARHFPAAKLVESLADIDPDTAQAHLSARYDSGALYRYGKVKIDGAQRYAPAIIERLARIPTGQEYRQSDLLAAQKRLLDSGYYNTAIVHIDTSEGVQPAQAPVIVQVQEAKCQHAIFGVGASTDRGARASIEYKHNQIPWLGWRMTSKLQADRKLQAGQVKLLSPPEADLWSWMLTARVSHEQLDDVQINERQMQWGRTKSADNIDRSYYLQYADPSLLLNSGGRTRSQAISGHYNWTYRQFNHPTYPTRGFGLGLQVGGGVTIHPHRRLFTRLGARYLGFWSLDASWPNGLLDALPGAQHMRQVLLNPSQAAEDMANTHAEQTGGLLAGSVGSTRREKGELILRAEAAAVKAKKDAVIPVNMLYLTGGDTSVRGYSYQELGVQHPDGLTVPGRYLLAASVEYRRPLIIRNRPTDWDIVAYIDTGSVANTPRKLRKLHTGVGAGVLWRSPVGPLQLSLAYGLQSKKARLHMNLGFSF